MAEKNGRIIRIAERRREGKEVIRKEVRGKGKEASVKKLMPGKGRVQRKG